MSEKVVMLPRLFQDPLFYPVQDTQVVITTNIVFEEALIKQHYFFYDIATYLHIQDVYEPWRHGEDSIGVLLKCWKSKKEELRVLFANRDRKMAKEPMIRSISYFLCFLFWGNQLPVPCLMNINKTILELKCKPINVDERLGFIYGRPDHFHSFIQLSQLFEEFEKQYYKSLILNGK